MIGRKNVFNQPIKSDMRTYDNIQKFATVQGVNYTAGCLLDYNYFNNYYKLIATDLSKQKAFDADPKAIEKINFTGDLDRGNNVFHYWRSKRNHFRFFTKNCESIVNVFHTFILLYITCLNITL